MRVIPLRPIVIPWSCQRTGDCCRSVDGIAMTTAERDVLLARRPDIADRFEPHDEPSFVTLRARPCPLLEQDLGGPATCSVHDIRPLNCRRFSCYRPDPAREPYEEEAWNPLQGQTGCTNLSDRLRQSRAVRRDYALHQRRAHRKWGLKHGWRDDGQGHHR